MKWVVYTEIIRDGSVERWYYGTYDEQKADDVAYELGHNPEEGIYHCSCRADKAKEYGILNLPPALQ